MLAQRERAALVLIDMQPNFLGPIDGGEKVLARCQFLIEIATLLGVRILATEQYPSRMGATDGRLTTLLNAAKSAPIPKMSFSCAGSGEFMALLTANEPSQVVLIGIETHICVNQTAQDLLGRGIPVLVGADAVGSRSPGMHEIGLNGLRSAGAGVAHTESIAYEWLLSAEDPMFRDALSIVKRFAVI